MKRIAFILTAFLCLCSFGGCKKQNEPSTKLTLSTYALTMNVGDVAVISAEYGGTEKIMWKSSNPDVATVNDGIVDALKIGLAEITAYVEGGTTETCKVSVMGAAGASLRLDETKAEVEKGETLQLHYSSSYDVPLSWRSSNTNVASVSESGVVTALMPGVSVITLSNGLDSCQMVFAVKHHWGEYQLVWEDNFDGTELDMNNWTYEVNGAGGGNGELQYYTDRSSNIRVQDGMLIIQALKDEYSGRQYTSARINSRGKKYFKYGKVEARISFPAGGGTWPAFWMMGNDYKNVGWPKCGEIDIIEHVGNDPRMLSFAVHTPEKNTNRNWASRSYFDDVEENFHVYGIEWVEEEEFGCDKIYFTFDGKVCAKVSEAVSTINQNFYWPFNKDHFIILNLAIGGKMGGHVDDKIFDNDVLMKVDWVKVSQRYEVE